MLSGSNWEFPHLIIHTSKKQPDKALGNFYNVTVSSDVDSLLNFDIPAHAAGKTCNLEMLFPKQSQLETSAFELKGKGGFRVQTAYPAASVSSTYNNAPKPAYDFGVFDFKPGNAYQIGSHQCPAGNVATFQISAVGDSYLNYFQDSNPCREFFPSPNHNLLTSADLLPAIGFYITIS